MGELVSVIVCCYNSDKKIGTTLLYLSKLELDKFTCEIILVDNKSIDKTVITAQEEWIRLNQPYSLTIISEEKPGLSNARRAGISFARGNYIIFCDDDNWLSKNYLITAIEFLKANPTYGILGGRSKAANEQALPTWFKEVEFCYAVGSPHVASIDTTEQAQIWGAGMVARKEVLEKVFDNEFPFFCSDRKGTQLTSGGDDEICVRATILGYKLYHHFDLFFLHDINPQRLSWDKHLELINGFVITGFIHQRYIHMRNGLLGNSGIKKVIAYITLFIKLVYHIILLRHSRQILIKDQLYFMFPSPIFSDTMRKEIHEFYLKHKINKKKI